MYTVHNIEPLEYSIEIIKHAHVSSSYKAMSKIRAAYDITLAGSVLGWFGKGRDSPNSEESEEGIFERIFGGKKEESKEEQEKLKPTKYELK